MENVSSNQELLELRRDGKLTEDEYKQLLDVMNKSLPNDSQKRIKNNKKYIPWISFGVLLIAGVLLFAIAALNFDKAEDISVPKKKIERRIVDKIDYPFVNDPEVIGTWESVDFVGEIDDFHVDQATRGGGLYLKKMVFFDEGKTGGPWIWTKGLIIHTCDITASKYDIKEIDGEKYMFFEWKSGDYTIRGMKPSYYVLKKALETAKSNCH